MLAIKVPYSQIWYGCVLIRKGRVGKDLDKGNTFDIFGRFITSIEWIR